MPRLYLGTMTMGWSQTSSKVDESIATAMWDRFAEAAEREGTPFRVDTARIYAGGKTERIVGNILVAKQQQQQDSNGKSSNPAGHPLLLLLGTKAHPSQPGGLSAAGIQGQWQESLQALQVQQVHEYYLHQPDTQHDLEESLRTVNDDLINQGKVQVLGMSNYHVSEMQRAFGLCLWSPEEPV